MAGLKKARRAAEKLAAAKARSHADAVQAKQNIRDREMKITQAPQTQPTNPWLMTTSDMTGGNTER